MEFNRYLPLDLPIKQSAFIFGPRKVGKSTFLKKKFPQAKVYDFLNSDQYHRLLKEPHLLREDVLSLSEEELQEPIILDEIQKIPELLDEVHWLIENSNAYFILCGSSARKLKKSGVNLLGGRAWSYKFYPLIYPEFSKHEFDLLKIFNRGLIPSHYQSPDYLKFLKAYVHDYLNEEIKAESLVRNLNAFAKFLESLAFSNGEITNYTNIARDCGIDAKTVKEYYQILVDTLIGYYVEPFSNNHGRASIAAHPKFYLFDVGVAGRIAQRTINVLKGSEAGKAFENYILMELIAYIGLNDLDYKIKFWRTQNGSHEVDFIITKLNQPLYAIEVKIDSSVDRKELKSLVAFKQDNPEAKLLVVSLDPKSRKINLDNGIEVLVLPVEEFLNKLWTKKFFSEIETH